MRIGTVTFWNSTDNYGQILQCYALSCFLRQMGHEVFVIRHKAKEYSSLRRMLALIWCFIFRHNDYKTALMWQKQRNITRKEARLHPRYFDDFRAAHIPLTEKVYTYEELKRNPPKADAYVCGSDQIWGGASPLFFLQFGSIQSLRIAYAPSMGGVKFDSSTREIVQNYLKSFQFISSREKSGVAVLKEMGYDNARLVPDPTLLLSSTIYRKLFSTVAKETKDYILVYLLGNKIDVSVSDIISFAEKHGLGVKYVASQGQQDEYPKLYPRIEEWLSLIDGAKYVITNSFHGTCFSLIFNVPFLTIPVSGTITRMNNRIVDMLEKYNLSQRIYRGTLDVLFEKIDFSSFNRIREIEEKDIKETLNKILS